MKNVIPLGGFMKESLYLHIPAYEELWYRQKIMQDPDTMSYNKDYDLNFNDYDKATGCIDFPKKKWADWYIHFIGQEPHRFYAYIVRESDGEFIGEVNVHRNVDADWYEMGIVLEAKYRGKGYAVAALQLLLQYAFEKPFIMNLKRNGALHCRHIYPLVLQDIGKKTELSNY